MSPAEKRRARIRASLVLTLFMVFGAVGLWYATREMWVPDLSVMRAQTLTNEEAAPFPTQTIDDFRSYPFVHRAYKLMGEGQYREAEIYLARAREANPTRAHVWVVSAQAALQAGNAGKAITYANEAVQRDDANARAVLYRAIALDVAGEKVAARVDYSAALSIGGLTDTEARLAEVVLAR